MSRNILNLLPNAVGQAQLNIVYAEVASPAPTSFSDPLFVYLVDWTTDFSVRVDSWNADHGSTLPAVGSPCQLVKDSRENWRATWWNSSSTAFAPTGTAGGDLTGSSYPNPHVATVLNGQTPLAIDGAGKSLALQLLSAQKLQVTTGSSTVAWPGGTTTVTTTGVNTGLSTGAFGIAIAVGTQAYAVLNDLTPASVKWTFVSTQGVIGAGNMTYYWLAFG